MKENVSRNCGFVLYKSTHQSITSSTLIDSVEQNTADYCRNSNCKKPGCSYHQRRRELDQFSDVRGKSYMDFSDLWIMLLFLVPLFLQPDFTLMHFLWFQMRLFLTGTSVIEEIHLYNTQMLSDCRIFHVIIKVEGIEWFWSQYSHWHWSVCLYLYLYLYDLSPISACYGFNSVY